MRYLGNQSRGLFIAMILAAGLCGSAGVAAQESIPDNLGGGLRQLLDAQRNARSAPSAALLEPRLLRDPQSRVLVNVWLDGTRPLANLHQALAGLGAHVSASFQRIVKVLSLPMCRLNALAMWLTCPG